MWKRKYLIGLSWAINRSKNYSRSSKLAIVYIDKKGNEYSIIKN